MASTNLITRGPRPLPFGEAMRETNENAIAAMSQGNMEEAIGLIHVRAREEAAHDATSEADGFHLDHASDEIVIPALDATAMLFTSVHLENVPAEEVFLPTALYNRALVVASTIPQQYRVSTYRIVIMTLVFNLALAHHRQGLEREQGRFTQFLAATKYYREMLISIRQEVARFPDLPVENVSAAALYNMSILFGFSMGQISVARTLWARIEQMLTEGGLVLTFGFMYENEHKDGLFFHHNLQLAGLAYYLLPAAA